MVTNGDFFVLWWREVDGWIENDVANEEKEVMRSINGYGVLDIIFERFLSVKLQCTDVRRQANNVMSVQGNDSK